MNQLKTTATWKAPVAWGTALFYQKRFQNLSNYFVLKSTICLLEKKQIVMKFTVNASCNKQ